MIGVCLSCHKMEGISMRSCVCLGVFCFHAYFCFTALGVCLHLECFCKTWSLYRRFRFEWFRFKHFKGNACILFTDFFRNSLRSWKQKNFSSFVEAACSIIVYFLQTFLFLGKTKPKLFRFLKCLFMFIWSWMYNYWWALVCLPLLSKFIYKNVSVWYQIGNNRCVIAHECV